MSTLTTQAERSTKAAEILARIPEIAPPMDVESIMATLHEAPYAEDETLAVHFPRSRMPAAPLPGFFVPAKK